MTRSPLRLRYHAATSFALAASTCLSLATTVNAAESVSESQSVTAAVEGPFALRVASEKDRFVALEVASRQFTRPDDPNAPIVAIVGVVHVGDRHYYRKLQRQLDEFDLVLYESVKPEGAVKPRGDNDEERFASTRAAMRFLAAAINHHHRRHNAYPVSLDVLIDDAGAADGRLSPFLRDASTDAWDHPLVYVPTMYVPNVPDTFTLTSLGADGQPGGSGAAADLTVGPEDASPLPDDGEDNIQVELAHALKLRFQLEALDYAQPNFRCSDMTVDQLRRAFEDRDSDFTIVEGTLAGSSFPAQIAKVLLGVVRLADSFMGGAVSDAVKVLLIEMLSDESLLEWGLADFGEAFDDVIIGDRNQVVIDDLRRILEEEPDVRSIALFYGAGHAIDLADRLHDQLGYVPGDATWLPAITIDYRRSAVTEADVKQLRFTVKRMLWQAKKMREYQREREAQTADD